LAGCRTAVVARNPEKFAPTADILGSQGVLIQLEPWERLQGLLPQAELLVNCTPLGTVGEYENQIPCELDEVPVSCVVADLVYRPLKTCWISQAFARGNPTIGGQRMLLWQAAKSIELWTGESAPVEEMWEELQSALCK
jgi:shikimate dehydrogenase